MVGLFYYFMNMFVYVVSQLQGPRINPEIRLVSCVDSLRVVWFPPTCECWRSILGVFFHFVSSALGIGCRSTVTLTKIKCSIKKNEMKQEKKVFYVEIH